MLRGATVSAVLLRMSRAHSHVRIPVCVFWHREPRYKGRGGAGDRERFPLAVGYLAANAQKSDL